MAETHIHGQVLTNEHYVIIIFDCVKNNSYLCRPFFLQLLVNSKRKAYICHQII